MDLSALIFVALAVAWAVYLVPKALKAHEVDAETRSVDKFSDRMRVLAHREPVSASRAELQVKGRPAAAPTAAETAPAKTDPAPVAAPAAPTPAQRRARRAAAARAAQRRRRVLGLVLLANAVVIGLAVAGTIAAVWTAVPGALLVAWLVACRLMVRNERRVRAFVAAPAAVKKRRRTLADEAIAAEDSDGEDAPEQGDHTEEIPAVSAGPDGPTTPGTGGWDPVPVTLPTYVGKAAAGRTVRTIDLDSTGVWSSGRNAADSELARAAEQTAKSSEASNEATQRRVSGA